MMWGMVTRGVQQVVLQCAEWGELGLFRVILALTIVKQFFTM